MKRPDNLPIYLFDMNNSDIVFFFVGRIQRFIDIDLMFTSFILEETVSHASDTYKTFAFQ